MTVVRQSILSTIMLKNVKLCYGNFIFQKYVRPEIYVVILEERGDDSSKCRFTLALNREISTFYGKIFAGKFLHNRAVRVKK